MSREAMKLALEALENPNSGLVPHNGEWCSRQSIAITALRAALAEPECKCTMRQKMVGDGCAVCNPERAKDLAEPEQNPFGDDAERYARKLHEEREYYKAIFTAPTPRKPLTEEDIFHEAMAIITRIQKDDWVATDQDIIEFARAIERAHGIGGGE